MTSEPDASRFHEGERAVHARVGVQEQARRASAVIRDSLPHGIERWLRRQRLAILSLEDEARYAAALVTGRRGFVRAEGLGRLAVRVGAAPLPRAALSPGSPAALLLLDPERGERFRVNGRVARCDDGLLVLSVREAFPNCPQGVVRRKVGLLARPVRGEARRLDPGGGEVRDALARADTVFLATGHPERGLDVSHKSGEPGFVAVAAPGRLILPDRDGNRLFQSLGNLEVDPRFTLLVPDFERRTTVELRGRATVRYEPPPGKTRYPRHLLLDVEEALGRADAFAHRVLAL